MRGDLACTGTAEERGMRATRGHQMQSADEVTTTCDDAAADDDDVDDDVYQLPVPACFGSAAMATLCRYVPFVPCYDERHISTQLRRALSRICPDEPAFVSNFVV